MLGFAQVRLGESEHAIEAFFRAVERAPEDLDAWNMLGESLRLAGRTDRAIATLERAASIDSSSPVTRFLLGEANRDAGRLDRAVTAYRDAVRLEPEFAPGWFGLGAVLIRKGQKDELPEIIARLQRLDQALGKELARMESGNR